MNSHKLISILTMSVIAAGVAACAAPVESEEIDEAALALGETGCRTVTASEVKAQPVNGGQTATSTSPDGSYNIDSTCPKQWVAEFSPDSGNDTGFDPDIYWADAALTTEGACEAATLELGIYRKVGSTWDAVKTEVREGVWSGGQCTFPVVSGGQEQTVANGDVIRLAGAAYSTTWTCSGFFCYPTRHYKKVSVSLQAFY